jgi:putative ATP-dependent endonuclease of the OLD family
MRLTKLKIQGFRSFGKKVTITIKPGLTAFIGINSSGKTSALDALRKMFSSNFSEREFVPNDFHHVKGENSERVQERFLFIETRFDFGKNPDAIPHFFLGMVTGAADETPYLRLRLEAFWKKSAREPDGEIEVNLYTIKVPEEDDIEDSDKLPFPNHLRSLIQILYVPAIRRPSDQLKYASGSLLHRVLRKIKWTDSFTEKFNQQIEDINKDFKDLHEFKTVQSSINQFWQQFHREERYRETSVSFGGSDFDSILKKLEVSFGPSATQRDFRIDELGDGFRSLFYLTLVCSLLDIEEKFAEKEDEEEIGKSRPLITLLAIEEPENHIAPQLLGRVVSILDKISDQSTSQVIISSHTPAIIKRIAPESIRHFRMTPSYETKVKRVTLPEKKSEAYQYVRQAVKNYPELYFAKVVVIGEGDSEEIVFNRFMDVMDLDFDDNIITFAPLGHRFVNHIWKLLAELDIPHVTLLDFDLEREGGAWGRIKYALQQLLLSGANRDSLLVLSDKSILSDKDLDHMHEWEISERGNMNAWRTRLENYNVFYSNPLDLDFVMLTSYEKFYKRAIPAGGGPKIPERKNDEEGFEAKVNTAVKATLKSESAKGSEYTQAERELMIWYNYHFLGRGKPATHIEALALMANEEIISNLPKVFNDIFGRIKHILDTAENEKD